MTTSDAGCYLAEPGCGAAALACVACGHRYCDGHAAATGPGRVECHGCARHRRAGEIAVSPAEVEAAAGKADALGGGGEYETRRPG